MESRRLAKRLISGSVLRVTLLACNIGVSFFMMPFLIHVLGDRWYGFWTLIGTFMGFYGFLDLGLSSAVSRFISKAYGRNDYNEINSVINTSLVLFSFIGFVAFVISCLAAALCPYFIKDYNEAILFRKVILILGISLSIGFPIRAFSGILSAKIRYDLVTYVELFKLFVRSTLIVYFLKIGYGILSLALITFFVELASYVIFFFLVKREFRQLKFSLNLFKAKRIKTLFHYSSFTFIIQLADILRFKVDSFVIAGFLNLSLVTHYFVASRLLEYFLQFIVSSVGIMSPVFSQYEGRGDIESIRKIFLYVTKISVILAVFVGTSLIIYGSVFIEKWMGTGFNDSYNVVVILCIPMITALIQNPSIGLLYGISKHHYIAFANSCEGVINLILSLILLRYYGIYGVALGTAVPMLFFKLVVQPIYVCRVIKLSLYKYYFEALLIPGLKTLSPILLYYYLTKDFLSPNYVYIFSISLVQLIIFIPIAFFLIIDTETRRLIKQGIGITR